MPLETGRAGIRIQAFDPQTSRSSSPHRPGHAQQDLPAWQRHRNPPQLAADVRATGLGVPWGTEPWRLMWSGKPSWRWWAEVAEWSAGEKIAHSSQGEPHWAGIWFLTSLVLRPGQASMVLRICFFICKMGIIGCGEDGARMSSPTYGALNNAQCTVDVQKLVAIVFIIIVALIILTLVQDSGSVR